MTPAVLAPAHRLFALEGVAEATIIPFFPLLLSQRGLDAAEIGLLLAAMALAGFVANPLWGYAADRRLGSECAFVASAGGAAVLALALLFPVGTVGLAVAAVALWSWRAPLASLADAIALDRLAGAARSEYGPLRVWMSGSWAIAAVVWGFGAARRRLVGRCRPGRS